MNDVLWWEVGTCHDAQNQCGDPWRSVPLGDYGKDRGQIVLAAEGADST